MTWKELIYEILTKVENLNDRVATGAVEINVTGPKPVLIVNGGVHQVEEVRLFADARRFVRNLRLKDKEAWKKYCSSKYKPMDIPDSPDEVYKSSGWIDWEDWLTQ